MCVFFLFKQPTQKYKPVTIEDTNQNLWSKMDFLNFSWIDYTLFVLMFCLSLAVGIYYGCCSKQQNTTTDYLLGGKKMKIFPVAMSLVAR